MVSRQIFRKGHFPSMAVPQQQERGRQGLNTNKQLSLHQEIQTNQIERDCSQPQDILGENTYKQIIVTMQRINTAKGVQNKTQSKNDRIKCAVQSSSYHSKKKKNYAYDHNIQGTYFCITLTLLLLLLLLSSFSPVGQS